MKNPKKGRGINGAKTKKGRGINRVKMKKGRGINRVKTKKGRGMVAKTKRIGSLNKPPIQIFKAIINNFCQLLLF